MYKYDNFRIEYPATAVARVDGVSESNIYTDAVILVDGSLIDTIPEPTIDKLEDETSKCKSGEKEFKYTLVDVMSVEDDAS